MIEPGSTNRASRSRRFVALIAWAGLVLTAAFLWSARQNGSIRSSVAEPICFLLASFAALAGVFAWMLFNPNRRSARDSGALFLAAAATLFPPPIIGFCLMPADSPLRGWLAFAVFMLCVIAMLSHIPDEFIGVPRGRHTYLIPIPAFDRVKDSAMDPDAAWFRISDLSQMVADTERPSLAPRAYLQREDPLAEVRQPAKIRPASDVDDILGTDLDLDFLNDSLADDAPPPHFAAEQWPGDQVRSTRNHKRRDENRPETSKRLRPHSSGRRSQTANDADLQPTAFPQVLPHTQLPSSAADTPDDDRRSVAERRVAAQNRSAEVQAEETEAGSVTAEEGVAADTLGVAVAPLLPRPMGNVTDVFQRDDVLSDPLQQKASATEADEQPVGEQPAGEQPAGEQPAGAVPEGRPARSRTSRYDTISTAMEEPSAAESQESAPRDARPWQAESSVAGAAEAEDSISPGLQRSQDESGSEVVEGVIRVRFDKGQKRANLHVPFSPPLAGMPDVECECVGDEPLRLKVPVRQSYGIRIEARRSNADEALDTEVGFAACCPSA